MSIAAGEAPEVTHGVEIRLSGLRRTAAKRMILAWQAPVFHVTVEVDMTQASRVKSIVPSATVTDVISRAAAAALVEVPEVNVHVGEESLTQFSSANVGIAVASPKGLVVPIVHDAQNLTLSQISEARADIVNRARAGGLTRADITEGTFTISNLGMMGVVRFDAILNVPQAAILAVGATVKRYVLAGDGVPAWVPLAEFTLTCDHRALDGAIGATFLGALKRNLESSWDED
jgi:pyruvate dehydrogenase E2 component (dihydrolipoamide acetyltransferase)